MGDVVWSWFATGALFYYCKNYRDEEKEPPSLHDNE